MVVKAKIGQKPDVGQKKILEQAQAEEKDGGEEEIAGLFSDPLGSKSKIERGVADEAQEIGKAGEGDRAGVNDQRQKSGQEKKGQGFK